MTAAFLLPQFHRIPENDLWWGEGFTEWTNVRAARSLFDGHEQPRLPTDLGYYDLLDPDVREAQAALAAAHDVDAFCWYHYWFDGTELLQQPFAAVLERGEPAHPFFLCWANENWTRRWDRGSREVLQPQRYSAEDDVAHIRALLPALGDDRYVRIGGRRVFLVYQAHDLPDPQRTTDRWREEVSRAGLGELHLVSVDGHDQEHPDPATWGFDATVRTVPAGYRLSAPRWRVAAGRARDRLGLGVDGSISRVWRRVSTEVAGPRQVPYEQYRDEVLARASRPWREYGTVMTGFDNTPRVAERGVAFTGSTPRGYQQWLEAELARTQRELGNDAVVFVNAWNEWAEGAYLEPCERWGRGYLEAHRAATASASLAG